MGANQDLIDKLTLQLTAATTVEQGATTLINTMAAAAVDAAIGPASKAAVQAAMDGFTTADANLASAVNANTPPAPGPVVPAGTPAPVTPAATAADATPVTAP